VIGMLGALSRIWPGVTFVLAVPVRRRVLARRVVAMRTVRGRS
jgi:hypothetical protein